jgi:hypothetical protein
LVQKQTANKVMPGHCQKSTGASLLVEEYQAASQTCQEESASHLWCDAQNVSYLWPWCNSQNSHQIIQLFKRFNCDTLM